MKKNATSQFDCQLPISLIKRIERMASEANVSTEELVTQLLEDKTKQSTFFLNGRLMTPNLDEVQENA